MRRLTVLALMRALKLFEGPSWDAWRAVLKAVFAIRMSESELTLYRRVTGRTAAPVRAFREVWLIVGRRGGKSIVTALIAVYQTTCRTFTLAKGETGVFMVIAADRRQGRVIKGYISAMLATIGELAEDPVEKDNADVIVLKNGLRIEIVTSNFRTIRGYTVIGAACDEVAFWMSDESANPDTEILGALRPAMATQPDAILVCLTSPYARRGEVWKAFEKHYGKDEAPVLVVKADTRTMDPAVPQSIIDEAYEDDPAHAAAEYGAEFRRDVESFVSREAVDACIVRERFELARRPGVQYVAFVDPSGGSSDSMTMAIAHDERGRIVIDAVRERTAPFDPDDVVGEFVGVLRGYGIREVQGDHYAGEWPKARFSAHGVTYREAALTKSELYLELLPRLNGVTIELLDHAKTQKQLLALERRTARGGRQSIDHPPKGKDDVINAVAGVARMVAKPAAATFGYARIERFINGV